MIIISAIKISILLVKPKSWIDFAKWLYSKTITTSIVALILAAITLYYLIQSGITIVQILAVTAFVALLLIVGLAPQMSVLIKRYEIMVREGKLWKEYWLYILIWIALIGWGAKEVFFP
ncbi:hypothetical protein HY448_01795 [Candidatus Pacearchaeota archaeon]|nr:hypothetical protein [Candidatus Pacearchaeota archaeon]